MKISAASGHQFQATKIGALPEGFDSAEKYDTTYEVRNWNRGGKIMLYIGKGHPLGKRQVCVWYPNGKMWAGYGDTFKEAIDGAQRDGWMYAV